MKKMEKKYEEGGEVKGRGYGPMFRLGEMEEEEEVDEESTTSILRYLKKLGMPKGKSRDIEIEFEDLD